MDDIVSGESLETVSYARMIDVYILKNAIVDHP